MFWIILALLVIFNLEITCKLLMFLIFIPLWIALVIVELFWYLGSNFLDIFENRKKLVIPLYTIKEKEFINKTNKSERENYNHIKANIIREINSYSGINIKLHNAIKLSDDEFLKLKSEFLTQGWHIKEGYGGMIEIESCASAYNIM